MEVKKISLQYLLHLYVIKLFFIMSILIMSVVIAWIIALNSGFILPANHQERLISEITPTIREVDTITSDLIPDLLEYVVLNSEKTEILDAGTMSEDHLDQMWTYVNEGTQSGVFFRAIESANSTIIFRYTFSALFSNPLLRKIAPSAEIATIILFIVAFILSISIISRLTVKRIKTELQKLLNTVQQIEEQNLDFDSEVNRFKEFQTITDSLDRLKSALKASLEEQIKLEQTKSQQIGALAHDIKIPVTVIRGNSELLSLTKLNPKQQEFARDIHSATLQIENYSRTLIDMSKLTSSLSLNKSEIELSSILEDLKATFNAYIRNKKIDFEINNKLSPATLLHLDSHLVQRAILNTLHNAVEHGGSITKITLTTSLNHQNDFLIEVQDDGDGFNEDALQHGTELFYMSNKARTGNEHYGIGLNFASQVAKLHQGRFSIQNTSVGGQVRFILPSEIMIKEN